MLQHVTAHHLTRLACLYVRQSTLQQVMENTESTSRQYALRERARALGWADECIVVIDQDLGHSGASTADRAFRSNDSWLTSDWGMWDWSWVWRFLAWHVTPVIGIICWKSVPSPTP
jgi:hypothetical protein